jgi:tetratricopeptide (TPR) repeat protein
MHVFGDGVPLYLLENWHNAPEPDPAWLRELPSRLLNARFEVVDFTGRGAELRDLHEWRRGRPRLAVRWLYGPAGAGKTRLAAKFATESAADNWKVIVATPGPGVLLPVLDSQDLRPDGRDGLLLIVDYADRWPATHLVMLLSNRLFRHRGVKTRILMLARTADDWPAIRHKLISEEPTVSSQKLEPLSADSAERAEMFTAAVEGFARRYGTADVGGLGPPGPLEHADFALTLAVHMAALASLDAHVNGRRAPADMAGLTVYLLDRENDYWDQLYGDGTHELNPAERTFLTPPDVLRRAVFTAALTGPVDRTTGIAILEGLAPELPNPHQVLDDHAFCYPPASPDLADALEPLYPDRLTEDFIALTIPDHSADYDYPGQPWATLDAWGSLSRLIVDDLDNLRTPNARLTLARRRAVIFLASAAQRWPHVATNSLLPILNMFPGLAVAAGGPALTALASIGGPGPVLDEELLTVLEKVERELPSGSDLDLAIGADHLAERLAAHYLNTDADPLTKANRLSWVFTRRRYVGRSAEALTAAEQALTILRPLAESDPQYLGDLSTALSSVSTALSDAGRSAEALAPAREAAEIYRQLAAADPGQLPRLVSLLYILGDLLSQIGRAKEALDLAQEADTVRRQIPTDNPDLGRAGNPDLADLAHSLGNFDAALAQGDHAPDVLARAKDTAFTVGRMVQANRDPQPPQLALNSLLNKLDDSVQSTDALIMTQEAVAISRRLVDESGPDHLPDLARSLIALGHNLADIGRLDEAVEASTESISLYRLLAADSPAQYLHHLADALIFISNRLIRASRVQEALPYAEEAVQLSRGLTETHPGAYLPLLATGLSNLCAAVSLGGDPAGSLPLAEEAVSIARKMAESGDPLYISALGYTLNNLTATLLGLGRLEDAVPTARETVALFQRAAELEPWSDRHGLNIAELNLAIALTVTRREPTSRKWFRRRSRSAPSSSSPSSPVGIGPRSPERVSRTAEKDVAWATAMASGVPAPADDHAKLLERFSGPARRVVALAREEASLLNHNYIGTEHILLGLIREGEGVAARELVSLGISLEAVRQQVEEIIGRGREAPIGPIPFTPRATKTLELSLSEALSLGDDCVGTEHILLGVIGEGEGVAVQILVKLGVAPAVVAQRLIAMNAERRKGQDATG